MSHLKFENIKVYNISEALRGMRNPKNSWHLSDSKFGIGHLLDYTQPRDEVAEKWVAYKTKPETCDEKHLTVTREDAMTMLLRNGFLYQDNNTNCYEYAYIGPKDMKLAEMLIRGGPEHRKFLRQIIVTVDITAPLYWWKEADTYGVGVTKNSTSTMHKLAETPITHDCFKFDEEFDNLAVNYFPTSYQEDSLTKDYWTFGNIVDFIIARCEDLRQAYLLTQDTKYWKALIELLPNSWWQTRTVTMNYENLLSMCKQRRNHKLVEWREDFIKFARTLPYAQFFIFPDEDNPYSTIS